MKPLIIIIMISFILLIPITVFAQNDFQTNVELQKNSFVAYYWAGNDTQITLQLVMDFETDYGYYENNPIRFNIKVTETDTNEITDLVVMFHKEGETPRSRITGNLAGGINNYIDSGDAFLLEKISSNPNVFSIDSIFIPPHPGNFVLNPILGFNHTSLYFFDKQYVIFLADSQIAKQQAIASLETIKQKESISEINDLLEKQDETLLILKSTLVISEQKNDLYAGLSITFAVIGTLIGVMLFYFGQNRGEKHHEESKLHIEQTIDKTASDIVQKVVDVANAQLRVKDGGKVALRKEGNVAADITRNIKEEPINVGDGITTIVTRAKDVKPVSQNKVSHLTDTIVARNKKEVKADVILVKEDESEKDSNSKKEVNETSDD